MDTNHDEVANSGVNEEAEVEKRERERKDPKIGEKTVEGYIVGRNKTVVPPEEVMKLAQIGCKDKEIADWFGIRDDTLRFNFKDQLEMGRESLKQSLRKAQINLALGGNAVMLIWLGKQYLGQSDNGHVGSIEDAPLPFTDD